MKTPSHLDHSYKELELLRENRHLFERFEACILWKLKFDLSRYEPDELNLYPSHIIFLAWTLTLIFNAFISCSSLLRRGNSSVVFTISNSQTKTFVLKTSSTDSSDVVIVHGSVSYSKTGMGINLWSLVFVSRERTQ